MVDAPSLQESRLEEQHRRKLAAIYRRDNRVPGLERCLEFKMLVWKSNLRKRWRPLLYCCDLKKGPSYAYTASGDCAPRLTPMGINITEPDNFQLKKCAMIVANKRLQWYPGFHSDSIDPAHPMAFSLESARDNKRQFPGRTFSFSYIGNAGQGGQRRGGQSKSQHCSYQSEKGSLGSSSTSQTEKRSLEVSSPDSNNEKAMSSDADLSLVEGIELQSRAPVLGKNGQGGKSHSGRSTQGIRINNKN